MGGRYIGALVTGGLLVMAASVPGIAEAHGHGGGRFHLAGHPDRGHGRIEDGGDRGGKANHGQTKGDGRNPRGTSETGGWDPSRSTTRGGEDHGALGGGFGERATAVAGLVTSLSAGTATVNGTSYPLSTGAAVYQAGQAVSPGAAVLPAFGVAQLDASGDVSVVRLASPHATGKGLSHLLKADDKDGFKHPAPLLGLGDEAGHHKEGKDHQGQGLGEVSGVVTAVYGQSLMIGSDSVTVGSETAIRYRSYRITLEAVPVGVPASALVPANGPARLIRLWQDPNLPPERTTVGAVYLNGGMLTVGSYTVPIAPNARVIGPDHGESLSAIAPGTRARVHLNGDGAVQWVRVAGTDGKGSQPDR